jgi:hypothetical protein
MLHTNFYQLRLLKISQNLSINPSQSPNPRKLSLQRKSPASAFRPQEIESEVTSWTAPEVDGTELDATEQPKVLDVEFEVIQEGPEKLPANELTPESGRQSMLGQAQRIVDILGGWVIGDPDFAEAHEIVRDALGNLNTRISVYAREVAEAKREAKKAKKVIKPTAGTIIAGEQECN